jgi:lipid-A-disaccharide synthase-like uncharacterized protein
VLLLTVVGWTGQSAFFARSLGQWLASERAGRSLVPAGFWHLSILGSLMLAVYAWSRHDPVILSGQLLNLGIYGRNLFLEKQPRHGADSRLTTLLLPALLVLVQLSLLVGSLGRGVTGWLLVGWLGQGVFQLRFPLQWWVSERRGQACLPAAFWWLSLVGSALLLVYAVERRDPVIIAGQAFGWLTSGRNLLLIRRQRVSHGG